MDERQEWRLANLGKAEVDIEFFQELHGVGWPLGGHLRTDFFDWLATLTTVPTLRDDRAPRYLLERFFEVRELDSLRFAAAKLGMQRQSFEQLVPRLPELGLRKTYEVYPGLYDRRLGEDLTRTLRGLRFKTFGTHDSFCQLLHNSLHERLANYQAEPEWCVTSQEMAAHENGYRMYASTWDNLTMDGLSVKHSVWLDFGKPLSLPPDRCSKLFYLRNLEPLQDHLLGRGEPRDLDDYKRFLEVYEHAQ